MAVVCSADSMTVSNTLNPAASAALIAVDDIQDQRKREKLLMRREHQAKVAVTLRAILSR